MNTLQILDLALDDLRRGFAFYDRQREGLGEYFLDTLSADIDALRIHGGIHPVVFGYHRCLSSRFPYAIYYKRSLNGVHVWRVLDCRQDPKRTRRALDQG